MASVSAIRAALVAVIAAVPDIGAVHDYERYAKANAEFLAAYQTTISGQPQIRGWFVQLKATKSTSPFAGRVSVTHEWEIHGYLGLDDAAQSEKTFNDLTDTLRQAFKASESLGGVVSNTVLDQAAGLQVELIEKVLFAGVLAHHAQCRIYTQHEES